MNEVLPWELPEVQAITGIIGGKVVNVENIGIIQIVDRGDDNGRN